MSAAAGSTVTWRLPKSTQPRLVQPVVGLRQGSTARSAVFSDRVSLGTIRYGAVGAQGNALSPVELVPIDLRRDVTARTTNVAIRTAGGTGLLDALMVMPEVATLLSDGSDRHTALLTSKSRTPQWRTVDLGGTGSAGASSFDTTGRLVGRATTRAADPRVRIEPGGFTILTR